MGEDPREALIRRVLAEPIKTAAERPMPENPSKEHHESRVLEALPVSPEVAAELYYQVIGAAFAEASQPVERAFALGELTLEQATSFLQAQEDARVAIVSGLNKVLGIGPDVQEAARPKSTEFED